MAMKVLILEDEQLRPVSTADIMCFYSHDKTTHVCTADQRTLVVDYSLDHIMDLVDPDMFFRISRKTIVNRAAISDIVVYSKTRLKLRLKAGLAEPPLVSRDKVGDFKEWLA